jgi:hypothetical protein
MHFTDRIFKATARNLFGGILFLAMLISMQVVFNPISANAAAEPATSLVVNILNPDGTVTPVHEYTMDELEALQTTETIYYSLVNSGPTPGGAKAQGVYISTLLDDAKKYNSNLSWESGQKLLVYPTDFMVNPMIRSIISWASVSFSLMIGCMGQPVITIRTWCQHIKPVLSILATPCL